MEKKVMIRNYGVSTDTYFMIDAHQVPRKGLDTVYLHYERLSLHNSFGYIPYCELEFCYEDGTHFPVKLKFVEEMDLEQLIRRYDDSVKIHRHRKMKEKDLWLCPFQRLSAEEPFVRKETLEELSTLCDGNSFWRLGVKNRDRWDGNKEVDLTLYGTGVTWLLWMVWFCLSIYLFFYIYIQSTAFALFVLLLGSGLCFYLFFIRSARKITEKAKDIFYEAIFQKGTHEDYKHNS
ncbi:MAG: hypothetical protein K2J60_15185 [Acetatifactor sp.]|nr:hypothetical protein [Acetatifactor sp.]